MQKLNYGFDAPDVMRKMLLGGSALLIASIFLPNLIQHPAIQYVNFMLIIAGSVFLFLGFVMFFYGLNGKFRNRDLMLNKINWRGDEQVLDIGTGLGLMMNGAAKRLTTGKSIGIDIWNSEDLSENSMQNTLQNAEIEGVKDKIEVRTEDARKMSFADNSFDVILSVYCIHNIEDKAEQAQACFEIARVLKPNGKALIADFVPTHDYAKAFEKAGLRVISSRNYIAETLAPMWIVEATKI